MISFVRTIVAAIIILVFYFLCHQNKESTQWFAYFILLMNVLDINKDNYKK